MLIIQLCSISLKYIFSHTEQSRQDRNAVQILDQVHKLDFIDSDEKRENRENSSHSFFSSLSKRHLCIS